MKRRTFINNTVLAGLAGAALSEGPLARALDMEIHAPDPGSRESGAPKILRLKGGYYRHHPIDFSQGPLGALGLKGWGETVDVEAPLAETALVSMHAENIGLIPEIPYSDKGPLAGYMSWLEYEGRKVDIVRTVYPKILAAARAAGLAVVHVAMGEYGRKCSPFLYINDSRIDADLLSEFREASHDNISSAQIFTNIEGKFFIDLFPLDGFGECISFNKLNVF